MLRVAVSALILSLWIPASVSITAARGERVAAKRPNVLIVTFDTTRADRIGCYGYPSHTPSIDRLAAGSSDLLPQGGRINLTLRKVGKPL